MFAIIENLNSEMKNLASKEEMIKIDKKKLKDKLKEKL